MVRVVCGLGAISFLLCASCGTRGFEPDGYVGSISAAAGEGSVAASENGSRAGGAGDPRGNGSGSGGSGGYVEPATECALPWWGAPLAGNPGVTTCTDFHNPAMMAYGQSVIEECAEITGPVNESVPGVVAECCYLVDQTRCGRVDYVWCVDMPYFGDGTASVAVPETLDPVACTEAVDFQPPASVFDAAASLTGLWSACGPKPVGFAGNAVLFQGDGSFQILHAAADGTLKPAPGCLQAGLWGFLHGTLQLNMHMDDLTNMSHVAFSGPDMLKLRDAVFVRRSAL